jgi:hypothetical protein
MICGLLGLLVTVAGFCAEPEGLGGADVVVRITGRGPRPYVVLWIEEESGNRVRTLKVWGTKSKYQRKLKTWQSAGEGVDGVSGATRPNGDYRISWDGRNDAGDPVPAGTYVFRAESIREEGLHCQTQVKLAYTSTPAKVTSAADRDIEGLYVRSPSGPVDGQ